MRNALFTLVLLFVLASCTTITRIGNTFEGAADFRIVPLKLETAVGSPSVTEPLLQEHVALRDFSRFQIHPAAVDASSPRFFTTGDYIQVVLRTGMIGWFSEGLEQRAINDLFNSPVKGEIAIVANVTEGARAPGSVDSQGNLEGRVVFYSNDVYFDQRLNEFNVPIYGPARYNGGPLTIDLWVLELDRAESDQMSAVLTTLSSLSNEIPAMSLPGVDILSQIGTAFLQSNADDIIGHMTVTLAQPSAGSHLTDPILQVSDVIISRAENRDEGNQLLDGCLYWPRSGRVTNAEQAGAPPAYASCGRTSGLSAHNNIFVLGIREVPEGPNISSAVTLAELNQRITQATVGTSQTPDLSSAIEQAADVARSASAYSDSTTALSRITGGSAGAARQLDAELILRNFQCGLLVSRDRGLAAIKAMCGGDRAADRQLGMADLARLSQLLIARTCLGGDDLSFEALLPDDLAATGAADALRAKRVSLYPKVRPRPADGVCT